VRYWVCALAGVALFAGCTYLFSTSLVDLLETGTCASGNQPYVIARECPDGTGTSILLLVGSIFGLFVSAGVFALRGARPGSGGRGADHFSPLWAGWALFFTITGAIALISSLGSDTMPSDGKLGGVIVGATFLVMGLPVMLFWLWSVVSGLGGRDERPQGRNLSAQMQDLGAQAGTFAADASGDTISQLERLQKLRDSGALTEAEFQEQKGRLLRDR